MKFMVIGNGGREHALARKLAESDKVSVVYVAPGNGGTYLEEKCINVDIKDAKELRNFVLENKVDYTVVGPEKPLMEGIVDLFEEKGLKVFGPSKAAAFLEGSKDFAKSFAKKYGVQTANYVSFDNFEEVKKYLKNTSYPKVIKADGLAGGKGVFIVSDFITAVKIAENLLVKGFLNFAGKKIVIEEFLNGFEVSFMVFIDGKSYKPLLSSMDYKKAYDNDLGPNTGGMGAICPNPFLTKELEKKIEQKIILPTLEGIRNEKFNYKGLLYFGIMMKDGEPYLLEYNVRFGDPETEAVLPLLKNDFSELIVKTVNSEVDKIDLKWKNKRSCCVIATSLGYPVNYLTNKEIQGVEKVNTNIFHNGTTMDNGKLKTSGGRVLSIVGLAKSYDDAREIAYSNIGKISFHGISYRKDIGILETLK
jgi:phosphoribosylamine--glycine ligase